ncbi:hypothetical protein GKZ68_10485 [Hymenobacter sp. BRD128]|uniref:hypothetical protein n=1 Tax=Hymenobacter sp. BRD128 TaxID=2675878 RepID=UPI0015650BDA|nr:hypothetical protein [Hymenobacter sp. BRD128]QKG57016.1 hypothetical protein GKZ68_10485 [Hymenobacter sp. BRD128]
MAFDKESVPGFFGWAPQGRRVVADTAGLFGWSAGRATNLLITFQAPAGASAVRQPLTLKLEYAGNTVLISYDPNFPRLERQVPANTPITLSTSSTYYQPTSDTFQIGTNQVLSRVIQLDFGAPSVATILQKHYY